MRRLGSAASGDHAPAHRVTVVHQTTLGLFRRIGTLLAALAAVAGFVTIFGAATSNAAPTPPYNECPNIGNDNTSGGHTGGCEYLIVLNNDGSTSVLHNTNAGGPFDGQDDTLVGILNNSGSSVSNVQLSSSTDIFGFDGDGICAVTHHNSGNTPTYGSWPAASASSDTSLDLGQAGCLYGSDTSTYAGPGTSFSGYSSSNHYKTGTLTLSGGLYTGGCLAQGQSTYFSLESSLTGASFSVSSTTSTTVECGTTTSTSTTTTSTVPPTTTSTTTTSTVPPTTTSTTTTSTVPPTTTSTTTTSTVPPTTTSTTTTSTVPPTTTSTTTTTTTSTTTTLPPTTTSTSTTTTTQPRVTTTTQPPPPPPPPTTTTAPVTTTTAAPTTTTTQITATTVVVSPPTVPSTLPPVTVPSSAPGTGGGGAATSPDNGALLGASGATLLAGLVGLGLVMRRRRRA